MLVHRSVATNIRFAGTHLYTFIQHEEEPKAQLSPSEFVSRFYTRYIPEINSWRIIFVESDCAIQFQFVFTPTPKEKEEVSSQTTFCDKGMPNFDLDNSVHPYYDKGHNTS